ncbi:hypothetical protein ACFYQ5_11175 [Streptomyces sp. NPDC005794]|uniref:hypothetical protein n=1 Tax=Streptomyces sp. NPDC005794 TaxID=3364733 RepID=UPI0036CDF35B
MDQYDSRRPSRPTESDTPVYDRLLAEWQEAAEAARRRGPTSTSPAVSDPLVGHIPVPGARTSAEGMGGGK